MARHEVDREDLMREATALRERVEMVVPGEAESVVTGFREDGRMSLYFGADPAFHFDADGGLRRAFCDGDLYRSQGQTLARLHRVRSDSGTTLQRHDLEPAELQQFIARMRIHLTGLLAALESEQVDFRRAVAADAGIVLRLIERLQKACRGMLAPSLKN